MWISKLSSDLPFSPRAIRLAFALPLWPGSLTSGLEGAGAGLHESGQHQLLARPAAAGTSSSGRHW